MNKTILTTALLVFASTSFAQCEYTTRANFNKGRVESNLTINSQMPDYMPNHFQVEVGDVSIYFSDLNQIDSLLTNIIDFRDGEDNRKAEVFHQYTLSCKRGNIYIRDVHGDTERLSNRSVNILIEHLTYAKAVIGNKS